MAEPTRGDVRVMVFDEYDAGPGCQTYEEDSPRAIDRFRAKMALIPDEYLASATCEFGSTDELNSGHIEVSYLRPETDAEMAGRIADIVARRAQRERALLAAADEIESLREEREAMAWEE